MFISFILIFQEEHSPIERTNSQSTSSPTKSLFSSGKSDSIISEESQFTKENLESSFSEIKFEKSNSFAFANQPGSFTNICEEVLTSLTNSMQNSSTNMNNIIFKKSNSVNLGSQNNNTSLNMSIGSCSTTSSIGNNSSLANKKDNEKKIWRKRI